MDKVVAVEKTHKLACCEIESGIAGVGKPPVGLVNHTDAGIFGGTFIADLAATVGRTIVDQDDFEVAPGLVHKGIHTAVEVLFNLVNRNNDADFIFHNAGFQGLEIFSFVNIKLRKTVRS